MKGLIITVSSAFLIGFGGLLVSMFVSSPPTRAEFDALKVSHVLELKSIDRRLSTLEVNTREIKAYLINLPKK